MFVRFFFLVVTLILTVHVSPCITSSVLCGDSFLHTCVNHSIKWWLTVSLIPLGYLIFSQHTKEKRVSLISDIVHVTFYKNVGPQVMNTCEYIATSKYFTKYVYVTKINWCSWLMPSTDHYSCEVYCISLVGILLTYSTKEIQMANSN